jgi:carbon monoxide dehydrogenase subunit G
VIVSRTRTVPAEPEAVWTVVADPRRLARWWPRTERVKSITREGWTTVLRSPRGRPVRADWKLEADERPVRRAWSQEVEGTPFAKVLRERRVEARLRPADGGTEVTLELHQHARGRARFGGALLRRAARKELDAALDGLVEIVRPDRRGRES